jgi:predicted enzyme related to lactoylglutathione lyase
MLQRSSQSIALSLCAAVLFMAWATITKADQSLSVSPISAEPSHEIHNGKVVWADLVTTDVRKAASFYQAVFDWVPNYTSDSGYVELSHNGQVICSIVDYEDDKATARDSRWLISISVPDVDAALTKVRDNGGEVLESATDLPDRGRYSVVSDTQGAVFMLLRATGGDPIDDTPALNEWAWAELWTDDVTSAAGFYTAIADYDTLSLPASGSRERLLLGTDGKARALVIELPWDDVEPNWIPYIPVEDIEATLQRISNAGGAILVKTDGDEGHERAAIVMDPSGGVFAIQRAEFSQ